MPKRVIELLACWRGLLGSFGRLEDVPFVLNVVHMDKTECKVF